MILWGGQAGFDAYNYGGHYDPVSDSWTYTSIMGAPAGRGRHTAVWTGTRMIVWGGYHVSFPGFPNWHQTGGQYDPVGNSWTPMTTTGAPSPRDQHTAVWTGTRMIVWGGAFGTTLPQQYQQTGGQYDPVANSWTPTTTTGAPSGRSNHAAVWTGSRMIVWGGNGLFGAFPVGAQYDPVGDSWTASTATGAQGGGPTAVWTGSRMIVWGGSNGGGQYDPVGDSWMPTTTTGAPSPRLGHTLVWTGSRMIVWGGKNGSVLLNTGGQYDPVGDSWTATTTTEAPSARELHTAVWTGSHMIVWGGSGGGPTGAQYLHLSIFVRN
jgi:hypothetical protein